MKETYKIFISVDMEGVAGVVSAEQLQPSGFEYQRFRHFLTEEVNAAVEGAMQAGATEIVVCDAHANAQNLLVEKLNQNVQIVRSWPRKLKMMGGIDDSFHGAMLIGYHTATSNPKGVRAHTFSSATFTDVRLNGQSVPECVFSALTAGHFGVPVILMSGDDEAIKEAKSFLGHFEGAVTKWAYGFHSAKSLTPEAARNVIRKASFKAVKRIKSYKPFLMETPLTLEISFKNYLITEVLDYLPIVERLDSHTIRYVGTNIVEITDFLTFILHYRADLSP